MKSKHKIVYILMVGVVVLIAFSFQSQKQAILKDNIYHLDSIYTSFVDPLSIESFPNMQIIEKSDSIIMFVFDQEREHTDSLFEAVKMDLGHKVYYTTAVYFDVVRRKESQVDLKYSKLNQDYEFKVMKSRFLGSSLYLNYSYNFRITKTENKVDVYSIRKDGLLKLSSYSKLK